MNNLSHPRPSITPLLLAALVILTFRHLKGYDLELPRVGDVLLVLGVPRSRAFEVVARIEDALVDVIRPVGRPQKVEPEPVRESAWAVTETVRDYLMEHPGAVSPGPERRSYTDGFRRFIVGLYTEEMSLDAFAFALAVGVPFETLRPWLRSSDIHQVAHEKPDKAVPETMTLVERGRIAHIVALWRVWNGNLVPFMRALKEDHALDVSFADLREILRIEGHKKTTAKESKPDPEAIRGALERFFPGGQWILDGKTVDVTVGEQTFRFTWELAVDGFSAAHVGFDVRDAEDGEGVVGALEHGQETTGKAPLAVLLDNRSANLGEEVREKLTEMGSIAMSSTLFRAQNKAVVEGAFGLFAQTMPPIHIDDASPRETARSLLHNILTAYCAGRNHVLVGKNKTRAQSYLEARPTPEEVAAARARLHEIEARIRARNNRDVQAVEPTLRTLIEETFERLGLCDPESRFLPALAKHGHDAVLEAIAIFEVVRTSKTLDHPERYLLGIARRVADRNHHNQVYDRLVSLRAELGDHLLKPYVDEDERSRNTLDLDAYLDLTLEHAVDASRPIIARAFFGARLTEVLQTLSHHERTHRCLRASRLVAVSHQLPRDERSALIAKLAAIAQPIQAA